MTPMMSLWLPILLSSIVVFLLSSVIHMGPLWHRNDYPKMANEDQIMDAMRPFGLLPGDYMLPRPATMAEMKTAEFAEKVNRGPKIMMTVMPSGMGSMSENFVQWFAFTLIVGIFAAYVAAHALPPAAPWKSIFRFTGLTAFIAYAVALWPISIWYKRGWGLSLKGSIDGIVYGVCTAAVFCWLWPR